MQTVKGHMGQITLDGDLVVIEKKLRGSVRVPLASIQSVSIERAGIGMRGIRFAVAGGTQAGAAVAMGKHKDLAQDPYALTFKGKSLAEFEAFAQQVDAARAATR